MEEVNKSIADSVRSGQYFIDSRRWYFVKYVYPFVERSFFALIAAVTALSFLALLFFTTNTTSLVLQSTYVIPLTNTIKKEAVFKALDTKVRPNISLSKYMVSYFVNQRELYNFDKIDEQLKKVSQIATQDVYNQFRNYISINNVNSPQFVYQKDHLRNIEVTNVEFITDYHAKVYFTAIVTSMITGKSDQSNWVAELKFAISDLQYLLDKRSKILDFVVMSYNSVQLN
jgi:type IV secretory pathway component VirB8